MARFIALFSLLFLTGCDLQPGRWTWRHDDATYAERNRARDIDECEDYAVVAKQDGKIRELRNAREYGGWGSFEFEFCMNQRGWRMEFSGNGERSTSSPDGMFLFSLLHQRLRASQHRSPFGPENPARNISSRPRILKYGTSGFLHEGAGGTSIHQREASL